MHKLIAAIVIVFSLAGPAWAGDCKYFNTNIMDLVKAIYDPFKMVYVENHKPEFPVACGPQEVLLKNTDLEEKYSELGYFWQLRINCKHQNRLTDVHFSVGCGPKGHSLHEGTLNDAVKALMSIEDMLGLPPSTDFYVAALSDIFQENKVRRVGDVLVTVGYIPIKYSTSIFIYARKVN